MRKRIVSARSEFWAKKRKLTLPFLRKDVGTSFQIWSGKRGSNSRPQPWQGCALPTELFPQFKQWALRAIVACNGLHCNAISWVFRRSLVFLHQCFTASGLAVAATAGKAAAATSSSLKGVGLASRATSNTWSIHFTGTISRPSLTLPGIS